MILQKLFSAVWPDDDNLLPSPAQRQASQRIRFYWLTRGGELLFGAGFLWVVVLMRDADPAKPTLPFAIFMAFVALIFVLTLLSGRTLVWVMMNLVLFFVQGMLIRGISTVTALSYLLPYTFAAMLLSGRHRLFIQTSCIAAFWVSLIYEAAPVLRQVELPSYVVLGYNILLAAFTFQTLRYLNRLAVELNTIYVADEVQQRSHQFLARISHELRTPLNSVLGFAKMMRRTPLNDTQSHYLHQIIDESEQLNRLVSDLLDSAHLATGKMTMNLEPCDINAICAATVEEHRPHLPPAVELKLHLTPDMPAIQGDQVRLRQVVSNLVSNAIKYTSQGEIEVKTACADHTVTIEVRDSGIGIPPEEQKLVFVPFVQLDNRRVGVGLGLDIALQIVRLHGGDILLDSTPGQGSTFTVKLPTP